MPDVSVIVVNWNTRALLERCLAAVQAGAGPLSVELIVVDNASSDDSVAMVRERFPEARLIANAENVGFARANNQGLAVAAGRYCLLLNSDAFLDAGALERLVQYMDAHPRAGAAGPRLRYEDGSLQRSCFSFPTLATELWQALWLDRLFPRSRVFGRYQMTYWDLDDTREVDSLMGAALLLRREALAQVGGLDERFFMYSEEVDLCYRLRQAGWQNHFVHTATAIHLWGGSARQVPAQTFLRLYRSRVQFFQKHYGAATTAALRLLLFGSSLVRVTGATLGLVFNHQPERLHSLSNYRALAGQVWRL